MSHCCTPVVFRYAAEDLEEDAVDEDEDEMDAMERAWKQRDTAPAAPPSPPAPPPSMVQRLVMDDRGGARYIEEPQGVPVPPTLLTVDTADTANTAAASDRFLMAARERAAVAAESAAMAAALKTARDVQEGRPARVVDPGNFVMISLP